MSVTELTRWLEEVVAERYGGVNSRLARKVGITDSVFGRGLKLGTFGIETLLRIAIETGEPAPAVLRRGGKAELADLIESLYGDARPRLPREIEQVVELLTDPDPALAVFQRATVDSVNTVRALRQKPPPNEGPASAGARAVPGKRGRRGARSA